MTIRIPDTIVSAAEAVAHKSGVQVEELLVQALQAHFPPLDADLQAELDAWNLASDQDFAAFEARERSG